MIDRATLPSGLVIADGLPLDRLYKRFDAIARGRTHREILATDHSTIKRLAANQRLAAALGWTGFVLERAESGERLELRGIPSPGQDREIVPDSVDDVPAPAAEPTRDLPLPRDIASRVGNRLANVSWRSRMRWLDDGGR